VTYLHRKLSCFLPTTLAFPEERGESKRHRSRDAAGIRGVLQAARNRHQASAFERSLSEAGGGVRPVIPIQARKAKIEKRKKESGTPTDAWSNDPRFGAARADRSALACRRSTTALAAAN
jgi:hypothetical protein